MKIPQYFFKDPAISQWCRDIVSGHGAAEDMSEEERYHIFKESVADKYDKLISTYDYKIADTAFYRILWIGACIILFTCMVAMAYARLPKYEGECIMAVTAGIGFSLFEIGYYSARLAGLEATRKILEDVKEYIKY